jgi:dCMP deaminase
MNYKKLQNYLEIAETISKNSHDSQTKVGAVLVHKTTGAILATGYNGFVRGAIDENLPNTRPEKYKYVIHAEQNLLCNSARHGISTANCIVINTLSPCTHCLRLLWNSGIDQVYFPSKNVYDDFSDSCKMGDINISINRIKDFIKLDLTAKKETI